MNAATGLGLCLVAAACLQVEGTALPDPQSALSVALMSEGDQLWVEALTPTDELSWSVPEGAAVVLLSYHDAAALAPITPGPLAAAEEGGPLPSPDAVHQWARTEGGDPGWTSVEVVPDWVTALRFAELRGPQCVIELEMLRDNFGHSAARRASGSEVEIFSANEIMTVHRGASGRFEWDMKQADTGDRPSDITEAAPGQLWIAGTDLRRFDQTTLTSSVVVPEIRFPDKDGNLGLAPIEAIATVDDAKEEVLYASSQGLIWRHGKTNSHELLLQAEISGASARITAVTPFREGRSLITFSGRQGYFVYDADGLRDVSVTFLGTFGIAMAAYTKSHGFLVIGASPTVVHIERAPDEWMTLRGAETESEILAVTDFLDGFVMAGRTGELFFYSDRTGLCTSEGRNGSGRGSLAAADDFFVITNRKPGVNLHEVWAGTVRVE